VAIVSRGATATVRAFRVFNSSLRRKELLQYPHWQRHTQKKLSKKFVRSLVSLMGIFLDVNNTGWGSGSDTQENHFEREFCSNPHRRNSDKIEPPNLDGERQIYHDVL